MADESVYGSCPVCGRPGVSRERRPNGNDKYSAGHVYPSADSIGGKKQKKRPIESFSITYIDNGADGKVLKADLKIKGRHLGGISAVECIEIPLARGFGLALVNQAQQMAKMVEDILEENNGS